MSSKSPWSKASPGAAAALAFISHSALTRSVRPLPSRPFTAPLSASFAAAALACLHGVALTRPSRPLPVRPFTVPRSRLGH